MGPRQWYKTEQATGNRDSRVDRPGQCDHVWDGREGRKYTKIRSDTRAVGRSKDRLRKIHLIRRQIRRPATTLEMEQKQALWQPNNRETDKHITRRIGNENIWVNLGNEADQRTEFNTHRVPAANHASQSNIQLQRSIGACGRPSCREEVAIRNQNWLIADGAINAWPAPILLT